MSRRTWTTVQVVIYASIALCALMWIRDIQCDVAQPQATVNDRIVASRPSTQPPSALSATHATKPIVHEVEEIARDRWHDARTWCDPIEPATCRVDGDCAEDERCVKPWWGDGERVCATAWPTKADRAWRRERVATIVGQMCSRRHGCDPAMLTRFLGVVALRESTWRPTQRHRLPADLRAAWAAYKRREKAFKNNPYRGDWRRWMTGIGLYGENPSIFVDSWHPMAPPEVLCREVEATAAYLERARRAVKGLIRRGHAPTLCDVHKAVSGGKLEPCSAEGGAFTRRAARAGLDPWVSVTEDSFGRIPRDLETRLLWADDVRTIVEQNHPKGLSIIRRG